TSLIAILYNLDRYRWAPTETPAGIENPTTFFLWFYILPVAIMAFFFFKGKQEKQAAKEGDKKGKTVDFDSQTAVERETDASII
ncbi:MAG: hypothetical protein AB1403_22390, partial [Candidatus Riflebacteria bacterium]